MKICLDAGHGTGQNQSPARCGYFEGDRMFTLQRLLQQELEAYGVTVVCTRAARQADPPLYTRALAAKDCDLFLSLHSNAAGNGVCESVDDPVVFYPVSGKGIGLAAELAECFPEMADCKDRCRYTGCSHRTEQGCAVLEAGREGGIPESRHKSYVAIYNELKDLKEWELAKMGRSAGV